MPGLNPGFRLTSGLLVRCLLPEYLSNPVLLRVPGHSSALPLRCSPFDIFASRRRINLGALNEFLHRSYSSIVSRSGGNGRDWPLTGIPPTATTQTGVLLNDHAASQIDSFLRVERAVTFPASHRNLCIFNVGVGSIVFVGHVHPPWPGS